MPQGKGQEILVQHQFIRSYDGAGGCHTVGLTREPQPLSFGKHGDAILACILLGYLMVRNHGHIGIAVCHLVFDGALHSYLTRRMKQYHLEQAIKRAPAQLAAGLDPQDLLLREWVVDTQCVAHGCHNACKWAMNELYRDSVELLKSLWKVFASLKSSAGIIHRWLPQWMSEHVAFVPGDELPPKERSMALWNAVGLPSSLLGNVCEEWPLLWENNTLKVAIQEHEDRDDTLEAVIDALVSILTIQGFTESRWLSVGKFCRILT